MVSDLFKKNAEWAEKFQGCWNCFYQTELFMQFCRSHSRRPPANLSIKVIRKDEPEFQQGLNVDVWVKFSDGDKLLMDEKMRKPEYANLDCFVVETVSVQPKVEYPEITKKKGWGYKKETVILYGSSTPLENDIIMSPPPLIFTISQRFIDDIVLSKKGTYYEGKFDNGKYWTIYLLVPRNILEKYTRG